MFLLTNYGSLPRGPPLQIEQNICKTLQDQSKPKPSNRDGHQHGQWFVFITRLDEIYSERICRPSLWMFCGFSAVVGMLKLPSRLWLPKPNTDRVASGRPGDGGGWRREVEETWKKNLCPTSPQALCGTCRFLTATRTQLLHWLWWADLNSLIFKFAVPQLKPKRQDLLLWCWLDRQQGIAVWVACDSTLSSWQSHFMGDLPGHTSKCRHQGQRV